MTPDLRELYQDLILDHYRRPRNFGQLGSANRRAEGYNPVCGDRLTVYLQVEEGIVRGVSFEGGGCAISTAAASLMTEAVKGKTVGELNELFGKFHRMLTERGGEELEPERLGKLGAFAGVREFPTRVKCATLAWHALRAALEKRCEPVTTEAG